MSLAHTATEVGAGEQTVLRLVVYGPASVGKTTTARALGANLGRPVETPEEEEDGTTVFFDWMEFEGGTFEGQAVRSQLITVPGHDKPRRIALLDVADVVIFVADTTEAGIDQSLEFYHEVMDKLASMDHDPAVIIQANKRDEPTALPLEEVRARFGLQPHDPLAETVASNGDGVRFIFVLAMRHGLERHARRVAEGRLACELDPDTLLEGMRAIESAVPVDESPDQPDHTETADVTQQFETSEAVEAEQPDPPPPPAAEDAITPTKGRKRKRRRLFGGPVAD